MSEEDRKILKELVKILITEIVKGESNDKQF